MSYELLQKILNVENEIELDQIIRSSDVLSNDNNWKPIGGFRGNFNQIHNQ